MTRVNVKLHFSVTIPILYRSTSATKVYLKEDEIDVIRGQWAW